MNLSGVGQFGPELGGQFAPESVGQFVPEWVGHFVRILHRGRRKC